MTSTDGSKTTPEGTLNELPTDDKAYHDHWAHVPFEGSAILPQHQRQKYELEISESHSRSNAHFSSKKEDVDAANLLELKAGDNSEHKASVPYVTLAVGTVDHGVQTANMVVSVDTEGDGLDDRLHVASLKEDDGEGVAHEARPTRNLPAPMHEVLNRDSMLPRQSVHGIVPSAEQRVGDTTKELLAISVLPPMPDQAAAEEIVYGKSDIVSIVGVQQNDDSLDLTAQASIPTPDVLPLGPEAAKRGAKEIGTSSPGSGGASRRSLDGSLGKWMEATGQSANTQSTSLSSIGRFLEDDHQSMVGNLDVDSNETDSTMGEITQSSTVSLNSEFYEHVEENGRSYHRYKQGKYMLPNDETEQNRLDLQHHLFLLTLQGELHLAPLKPGIHNALDIATGTGIWAIEFAAKFPSANIIGTDLSPIQPLFVPPNCHFEVDDAEDDWVYSHNFDYIHGRLLLSCFHSFPPIVAKAYDALHPGGWLELQDMLPLKCLDDSWNGSDIQRWVNLTLEGAARMGMDWRKVEKYKGWLEEAGFVGVQEVQLAWPTNTWPRGRHHKQLGMWMNQNLLDGIYGISVAVLTRGLGMTAQEVELLLVGVRKDLCNRNIHCYAPIRIIYGRKPGGEDIYVSADGLGGQDEVQIETFN